MVVATLKPKEGGFKVSLANRILLSAGILTVDLVVFFLPLTALFLIYILLANPPWFREFLERLDKGGGPEAAKERE